MGQSDGDGSDRAEIDIEKICKQVAERVFGPPRDIHSLMQVSEAVHAGIRERVLHEVQNLVADRSAENQLATFEQKSRFVKWLNAELRNAGLAIKCPKTGKSTFLEAVREPVPERGRFRFDHMDRWGKHHYTLSQVELPALEFVKDHSVTPAGRRRDGGRSR